LHSHLHEVDVVGVDVEVVVIIVVVVVVIVVVVVVVVNLDTGHHCDYYLKSMFYQVTFYCSGGSFYIFFCQKNRKPNSISSEKL